MKNIAEKVIIDGIVRGIRVACENECYQAAIILIYSGIDCMAFLNMPKNQLDVKSKDFIKWADRYIKFPCKEQLSGNDLYGARCGMLHTYRPESNMSRKGSCRQILYINVHYPEVIYKDNIEKDYVIISIEGLANSFLDGVDKSLLDLSNNDEKKQIAVERLRYMYSSHYIEKHSD